MDVLTLLLMLSENMVRGLDQDETNFLDEVSRQQCLLEKQTRDEEMQELLEYRISFTYKVSQCRSEGKLKQEVKKSLRVWVLGGGRGCLSSWRPRPGQFSLTVPSQRFSETDAHQRSQRA